MANSSRIQLGGFTAMKMTVKYVLPRKVIPTLGENKVGTSLTNAVVLHNSCLHSPFCQRSTFDEWNICFLLAEIKSTWESLQLGVTLSAVRCKTTRNFTYHFNQCRSAGLKSVIYICHMGWQESLEAVHKLRNRLCPVICSVFSYLKKRRIVRKKKLKEDI